MSTLKITTSTAGPELETIALQVNPKLEGIGIVVVCSGVDITLKLDAADSIRLAKAACDWLEAKEAADKKGKPS
jgi:hypothetical protein